MKDKYVELQNCLEKGNIVSMALLALMLSYFYKYIEFDFYNILIIFGFGLLMTFMFGGMVYGVSKMKFGFTLNPIKLIIYYYALLIKIFFYGTFFPFIYIKTLIGYGTEIMHERKQKKMC